MNKHDDKVLSSDILPKEMGKLKLFKPRTYDLMDLLTIGLFNLIVFSLGFSLGWLVWGNNAHL